MNRVELTGRIIEISMLRYTPSGLPVVDFKLVHESIVEETGIPRNINLSMKSIAIGSLAEKMILTPIDTVGKFSGFLASGKNSKSIIFHIQSIHSDS